MSSAKNRRKKVTSKGIVGGPTAGIRAACRAAVIPFEKELNKIAAWKKGQNPWLTIPSISTAVKNNKPFTRIKANDYWGRPNK